MKFSREEKIILLAIIIAAIAGFFINIFFSYGKKVQVSNYAISVEKININTAQPAELEKLPGIGGVTAKRIMEYRQKSGGFKTTEEIMEIKGMSSKKYEKIKNYITAGTNTVNAVK
jgi:comEA protein